MNEILNKYLKILDFSSVNYYFHINGKETFKTSFAGFSYLCVILFLIYYIYQELFSLFNKKNFKINSIEKIFTSPPELNLLEFNMNFIFGINYDLNKTAVPFEILNKYIQEDIYFVTKFNATYKEKKQINFKTCEKNDLLNLFNQKDDFFLEKKYLDFRCLSFTNFTLKGAFEEGIFQYLEYGVYLNMETFKNDFSGTIKFFSENLFNVIIKYFELSLNLDNIDNPIRSYEKNIFDYINFNFIKKINLDYSQYIFNNDEDLIFESFQQNNLTKLNNIEEYYFNILNRNNNVQDNNLLFKYYIRSSPKYYKLDRVFIKIPDSLAKITGIASNLFIIISFMNSFYNKFKSKEELVNHLLKFKDNYLLTYSLENNIKKLNLKYKSICKENNHSTNQSNNESYKKNVPSLNKKLPYPIHNENINKPISKFNKDGEKKGLKNIRRPCKSDKNKFRDSLKLNEYIHKVKLPNYNICGLSSKKIIKNYKKDALKNRNSDSSKIDNKNSKFVVNSYESIKKKNCFSDRNLQKYQNILNSKVKITTNELVKKGIAFLNPNKILNTHEKDCNDIDNDYSCTEKGKNFDECENDDFPKTPKKILYKINTINHQKRLGKSILHQNGFNQDNNLNIDYDYNQTELQLCEKKALENENKKNPQEFDFSNKFKKYLNGDKSSINYNKMINKNSFNENFEDNLNLEIPNYDIKEIKFSNIETNNNLFNNINENKLNIYFNKEKKTPINKKTSIHKNKIFLKSKIKFHKLSQISKTNFIKDPEKNVLHNANTINNFIKNKDNKKHENIRKISFNFSPFDIFCQLFNKCCPKKKRYLRLYKKAFHNINNHLNIYFYLKLIQEIEIIKYLAFNENQINIINFVSKPLMSEEVNFKNPEPSEIKQLFNYEADINIGIKAYKNIINTSTSLTKIDYKLLDIFKSELDSIKNLNKK